MEQVETVAAPEPVESNWNVVATLPEDTFRGVRRLLSHWDTLLGTHFYNLLLTRVAGPNAFLNAFAAAVRAECQIVLWFAGALVGLLIEPAQASSRSLTARLSPHVHHSCFLRAAVRCDDRGDSDSLPTKNKRIVISLVIPVNITASGVDDQL